MLIKYIGTKPLKKDVVADTGIYWAGHGDIQEVPDAAAPKLLAYVDIWRKADEAISPQSFGTAPVETEGQDGLLDALDLDAPLPPEDDQNKPPRDIADSLIEEERAPLLKRAEAVGLEVNPRWGIPTLAKRVKQAEDEAAKAKG